MFSALTRLCSVCRTVLPDPPAAPVCATCGRVACPHHTEWPPVVKWWLLAMLVRSLLLPWKSEQEVWEHLLRDTLNGIRAGTRPNPSGVRITMSTPAVELYPIAVERARAWKAAGSPITGADAPHSSPALRTGT